MQERISKNQYLWQVGEKEDGTCYLYRNFVAKNFQAALDSINAFGAVAEELSHHPNLHLTNYRNVSVELWTHKVKGVTENDMTLAARLDESVSIEYSPKWIQEHPEAISTAKTTNT